MILSDVLPDKWAEIAYKRYRLYRSEAMVLYRDPRKVSEYCDGCYGARYDMDEFYLYRYCIFNKCIKQYPNVEDKEEFK